LGLLLINQITEASWHHSCAWKTDVKGLAGLGGTRLEMKLYEEWCTSILTSLNRGRQTCARPPGSNNEHEEDPGRTSGALHSTRILKKPWPSSCLLEQEYSRRQTPSREAWAAGGDNFWIQQVTYSWKTTADDISHS